MILLGYYIITDLTLQIVLILMLLLMTMAMTKTMKSISTCEVDVLEQQLRVVTVCFMLVGSTMFGGTFNLVSHVGLP